MKFVEKRKQLLDGLAKAEEEYSQAQEALREAAVAGEMLPGEAPVPVKTPPEPPGETKMEGTPTKRSQEVLDLEDDQVIKKLRSPIHVEESPTKGLNGMDF